MGKETPGYAYQITQTTFLSSPTCHGAGVTRRSAGYAPAPEGFGGELRCSGTAWISLPGVELCHDLVDCQADFTIRPGHLGPPPRTFGTDMQNTTLSKFLTEGSLGTMRKGSPIFQVSAVTLPGCTRTRLQVCGPVRGLVSHRTWACQPAFWEPEIWAESGKS